MQIDLTELSRTISHALRHAPWIYELELDDQGWTPVADLLAAMQQQQTDWQLLSEADLNQMISQSNKKRFEMQNGKIRALYGHSLPTKLAKTLAQPPEILFHGTSPSAVEIIQKQGLKPMARQYVHLSVDRQTASEVGKRKSKKPVILEIAAAIAYENGVKFYQGNEMVWLADNVPPEYIK